MTRYDEIWEIIFSQPEPEEFINTDEGMLLLAEALHHAPPEIKARMNAKLRELGLIPEVRFVDGEGNPVFTLDQLAETLGETVEALQENVERLNTVLPFVPVTGVHRLH